MFSLLGGCRLLQNPAENRRDISAKLFGIFTHRKMAEPFHDGDAGAANRGSRPHRVFRRAGKIIFAGEQIKRTDACIGSSSAGIPANARIIAASSIASGAGVMHFKQAFSRKFRHWRVNGIASDRPYLWPERQPVARYVRRIPAATAASYSSCRVAHGATGLSVAPAPRTEFYRAPGISPKSQNRPAMMPSASSVTDSRMCSSGACWEQPG